MGYWENKLLEDADRGYADMDGERVCAGCVTDAFLASILADAHGSEPCSYCDSEASADISLLLDAVRDAIRADYADPADVLIYDGREGGYQGEVWEGDEVVRDLLDGWTEDERLLDDVAGAFGDSSWTKRDYYGLGPLEVLRYGWSGFSDQVKYRTRYLFLQEIGADAGDPDAIPPGQMLDALGKLFLEHNLFTALAARTEFVRARVVPAGERPATAAELGTAPPDRATSPNRMSPAGIPMFYAGFDDATAVLETYQPERGGACQIALARFQNKRPLEVLDLTSLPEVPSQFDQARHLLRDPIAFLHSFEEDLTRPVERDGRAHVEYVPTQIVTEFVRHRLKTPGGSMIDGIRYRSSRAKASAAVVLFADSRHCGPRTRTDFDPDPFLELVSVQYEPTAKFLHLWRAG